MRELYFELFKDIIDNYSKIIKGFNFLHLRKASFPDEGQNLHRYNNYKSRSGKTTAYIDHKLTSHSAWLELKNRVITRKIFDYIVENNLSPFEKTSFEEDICRQPSITRNLIADFVGRLSELSKFGLDFSKNSFDKAYSELEKFLYNDSFEYKVLVNLYGPLGDTDITIDKNTKILRANYEISKLFCFHHSESELMMDYEMVENDYYIEITRHINKSKWREELREEKLYIEKVFNSLLLSNSGNILLGKSLRLSDAWPLLKTERINYNNTKNDFGEKNLFRYEFNTSSNIKITENYFKLDKIDFEKLDGSIKASIKRLKKSKSTMEIEDKIIELVLSIEYLINTAQYEVTLQLCLKMIKMYNDSNQDSSLFKLLKDFFILRGNVVHGNKKVDAIPKNVELIKKVEEMTLDILVKFIILNQDYSLKQINETLDKSLYIDKSVEELLKTKSA